MTSSYRFEDRLFEQLRHIVAARSAPAIGTHGKPRRTRWALAAAGIGAASALVAIVAATGDVTPSAYAVQSRPDGAVTVSIRSLDDPDGLQHVLRARGIPAIVSYLPADKLGCGGPTLRTDGPKGQGDSGPSVSQSGTSERRQAGDAKGMGRAMTKTSMRADGNGVTFTIDPGNIKPGENVYITTSTGAVSTIGMAIGEVKPTVPCATAPATP